MKYNIIKRLFLGLLITTSILTPMNAFAAQNVDSKIISDWAKPAVTSLANKDLIPGSLEKDINYKDSISREEFAELMVMYYEHSVGEQQAGPSPFSDTNNPMLIKAAKFGLVAGNPDGTFKPNDKITREQVAAIIKNTQQKLNKGQEGNQTNLNRFSDKNKISQWAKPAVSYGVENKIIGGNADGTFNPQGKTSKEQAMSMMNAMLGGQIAPPVTPPPVQSGKIITGPEAEQTLRNIIADRNYVNPNRPDSGPINDRFGVNSFQHVKNGESFELNGQTITGVDIVDIGKGQYRIAPKVDGKYTAGEFISIFGTDGKLAVWQSIEKNGNSTFTTGIKPEQIKAIVFRTNNSDYVLMDINK